MAEFDEAIYQERERELIRRLGVTEAALEVASAEILRKDEQLRALGEELSQAKGSARHWKGVFREHDEKYGTLYHTNENLNQALDRVLSMFEHVDRAYLQELRERKFPNRY